MMLAASPLTHLPRAHHGEGPVWDADAGQLWWTDVLAGVIHRTELVPTDGSSAAATNSTSAATTRTFSITGTVGAVIPDGRGGAILLADDGFGHLDAAGTHTRLLDLPTETRGVTRMNDGACDARGRLWAGTMAFTATPEAGSVYRTDEHGATTREITKTTIANGIGWSADGSVMYFADTGTGSIWQFDYDLHIGTPSHRRLFVSPSEGGADGLCLDAEDHVWVALWGAGAVHRYAPDGTLVDVVTVTASQPTSCCFAGATGDELIISTSREGLTAEALATQPDAGLLFAVRPGVSGPPAHAFRGSLTGWAFSE